MPLCAGALLWEVASTWCQGAGKGRPLAQGRGWQRLWARQGERPLQQQVGRGHLGAPGNLQMDFVWPKSLQSH